LGENETKISAEKKKGWFILFRFLFGGSTTLYTLGVSRGSSRFPLFLSVLQFYADVKNSQTAGTR